MQKVRYAFLIVLCLGMTSVEASDFYTEKEKASLNEVLRDDYISQKKAEALSVMAHKRLKKIKDLSIQENKKLDNNKLEQIGWPDEALWLQYQAEQILSEKRENDND